MSGKYKKPTDIINLRMKDISNENLSYHIFYSLEKMMEFIYYNNNKIWTSLDNKHHIEFQSGYKIVNGHSGKEYDRKYLKNISGVKINFFKREKDQDDNLIIFNKIKIVRNNPTHSWYDMNSSSYNFDCDHYSYFIYSKKQYLLWINNWSKSLRKRIIKYLYQLQKNEYSDQALLSFFNRMNRNFDFDLHCVLGDKIGNSPILAKNIHTILEIVPILPTIKYREKAINKLVS